MATLAQLCPELCSIAKEAKGKHYQHRTRQRYASNYMLALCDLQRMHAFNVCKGQGAKKRVKNSISTEKAGKIGTHVSRVMGVVCRVKNI